MCQNVYLALCKPLSCLDVCRMHSSWPFSHGLLLLGHNFRDVTQQQLLKIVLCHCHLTPHDSLGTATAVGTQKHTMIISVVLRQTL